MSLKEKQINIRSNLTIFKGRPDLTPLVDVLFLLLIFFMLGSSFVQVSGIKVDLPEISYGSNQGVEKYVVTIDKDSNIFFNDQPVPRWDTLKEKLSQLGARSESGTIILRADVKTPFGIVSKLMSLAEEVNLNVFVVTVKPPEKKKEDNFGDAGGDE